MSKEHRIQDEGESPLAYIETIRASKNLPLIKHQMYEIHNFRVTLKNIGYPSLILGHQIIIAKINKGKNQEFTLPFLHEQYFRVTK